ncbi:MAG: serine/threonine protein phosphatase [Candidatus Saccharibacteria bacterium]|nr:serine/threonine protein phosphatase [Candidatus Saccharibacteria bacterium]
MDAEQLSYAVVPDTHGEYEHVARMLEVVEPVVDKIVFLGDVVDGREPRKLIDLIRELGDKAVTILGNHEWVLRNALHDSTGPLTTAWRDHVWLPGYESGMFRAYGVERQGSSHEDASRLRERLAELGHFNWLQSLPPYYETPKFVALHAGPLMTRAWSKQAMQLRYESAPAVRVKKEPLQLFSRSAGLTKGVPNAVDERMFITGHAHVGMAARRRAQNRVCLATHITEGAPLLVWHSAQDMIAEY